VPLFISATLDLITLPFNLLNNEYYNLLLTVGPFFVDGGIDILSHEVVRGF
jgi:hypothetical protein